MSDDTPPSEELKTIPGLTPSEVAVSETLTGPKDTAIQEAKLFELGLDEEAIKKRAAENEHNRNEKFRDHFEKIAVIFLYLIALLFFAVGATWFWHLLISPTWHWLTEPQVAKLQNIVTGGILASIATGHVKKRLS